ncbi:putative DNA endonuclease [Aquamicrobium phage P14]|uniref:Putative DNA endonuclease n=1 Tax=Aquamicrobium phage P14 TaxID=1927013 RepID=A0A1L5C052_9CAUD|nr:putative DNA endonuclease [Aquamicrobium phage P14]APL99484.1 putative DNA endonuclease [Aquamicrobium phage P14]
MQKEIAGGTMEERGEFPDTKSRCIVLNLSKQCIARPMEGTTNSTRFVVVVEDSIVRAARQLT